MSKLAELLVSDEGGVRTLTLNRPERRNALNSELIRGLSEHLKASDSDESVKAVVIRGAGKDFCSGADLSALQKISEASIMENLDDAEELMELFVSIRKISVPVIAAVHGRALAGGAGLAMACDLVVATRSARFGFPEVRIGFVPAMVAAIVRRNVSEKVAFELLTQGGEISPEEADRLGLVNKFFDDESFETELAEYIKVYEGVSRAAVALTKKLLYQIDGMTFEAAVQSGAEINALARMTDDCRAGIARFLEKK